MRGKYILQTLLFSLLTVACHENDVQELEERAFVQGDISIGIKSTVSISSVFELINENDLFIDQMNGFFNYSTFPNDSLTYVVSKLTGKEYLNKRGFTGGSAFISAVDNRITVTQFFFEMDRISQDDWLSTMSQLQLQDLGNDTKNLLVKVTPGTEKFWINVFKAHPYVTWAELNYIGGFEPLD